MASHPDGRFGGRPHQAPPGAQAPRLRWEEAEHDAVTSLRSLGLHVVDHPRTATFDSDTGQRIEPDLGLRLGTGGATIRLPHGPIDTLGEVKIQTCPGSAIDKLPTAIDRYSRLFHDTGIPTVIFHHLTPTAANAATVERLTRLAHASLVGFIPLKDVTATGLRTLVADLVRRRSEQVGTDDSVALALLAGHNPETLLRAAQLAVTRNRPATTAASPMDVALW